MTHYLRFTDEATWLTEATTAGIRTAIEVPTEEDPAVTKTVYSWAYYTHERAVDDIGTLYNSDGVVNPETGEQITPPTAMPGHHVNYVGELPAGWDAYVVTPAQPQRVFAGAEAAGGSTPARARNEDGTFVADDPATPDVDEAWVSDGR